MIGLTDESERPAKNRNATELARIRRNGADTVHRRMIGIEFDVAGNEEIQQAVAVVITPRGAGGPAAERDTRFFGDVGERAVVIVVVEAILAEVRDVDVWPAVVVVIRHGDAEAPAFVRDSRLFGDIG